MSLKLVRNWNGKIERLVTLKAQIAERQKEAKKLEADFKTYGVGVWEGPLHTLAVNLVESNPVDWKALCKDLQPSDYYIQKHTGHKTALRLTINVKKKEAA